jgi:hypothetical protein
MGIGEASEAGVRGLWSMASGLAPDDARGHRMHSDEEPTCGACVAAFARNCWGWIEPPKPEV